MIASCVTTAVLYVELPLFQYGVLVRPLCAPLQVMYLGDSGHQKVWVLHATGLYVLREILSCISVVRKFSSITSLFFAPDKEELYVLDR